MKLLSEKILQAADIISKAGTKGNGNWVIASPEYGRMLNEIIEEEEHKQKIKERRLKIEKLRNGKKKS
jgi:hypothetical protein